MAYMRLGYSCTKKLDVVGLSGKAVTCALYFQDARLKMRDRPKIG